MIISQHPHSTRCPGARRWERPVAVHGFVRTWVGAFATVGLIASAHAAVNINQQGLTGAWANAATSGQGMVIELFPDLLSVGNGYIFGSWYTFDTTAGGADHGRWYTYQASVIEGTSQADVIIYRSTGGTFATLGGTTTTRVGSGTIAFDSCTSGTFTYVFEDGRSGTIPLGRLMMNAACEGAVDPPPPINRDFGLSGTWADMATSAQGMVIEVNPRNANVFLGWYPMSRMVRVTPAANAGSPRSIRTHWVIATSFWTPTRRPAECSIRTRPRRPCLSAARTSGTPRARVRNSTIRSPAATSKVVAARCTCRVLRERRPIARSDVGNRPDGAIGHRRWTEWPSPRGGLGTASSRARLRRASRPDASGNARGLPSAHRCGRASVSASRALRSPSP